MIVSENIISKSLLAGVAIGFGGYIYLLCPDKLLGAFLFAVGLSTVCLFKLNLITGKSGFLSDLFDFRRLVLVLIMNLISAILFGLIVTWSNDSVTIAADAIVETRINTGIIHIMFSAMITGFLMTVAIESVNQTKKFLILIMCVAAFILSSSPHCIADAFYYGASSKTISNIGSVSIRLALTILFNFIGCNLYNLFVNKSFISVTKK